MFIDETGCATNMIRLRGRSIRGKRLRGQTACHWKMTTLTAGLRVDGLTAPMALDGPSCSMHDSGMMNGNWFKAYVNRFSSQRSMKATSSLWTI